MVFSSLNFLFLFLPLAVFLHLLAPKPLKNAVLLLFSIVFYAWGEPVYVVLMLLSIGINYVIGLQIGIRKEKSARRRSLLFGVAVNLLTLGFFKYYGFLTDVIRSVTSLNLPKRELALPIGISFYTFQALSYLFDVYRGTVEAQNSPVDFAAYITMFPQLVAGPIVKYADIRKQLAKRAVTWLKCGQGADRLIQGLAKKVLLANQLGLLYESIQAMPQRSVLTAWLGAIAYTLQIYFDFSGYSDMAIGMGKMLGFDFAENFDYPYISKSVTEFWRRWHMSLSGWFRDYVYIPLGGSRVKPLRHVLNLMTVWMLTGLWHGASWNFVLWGLYYGLLLILEKYVFSGLLKKLPGAVSRCATLLLVLIGWMIFSNTDFAQMGRYLANLFGAGAAGFADSDFLYLLRSNLVLLAVAILCSGPAPRAWFVKKTARMPALTAVFSAALLLACVACLVYGTYNPFLYFRF